MHTKLADVDDTRPPERFTLQSTARAAAHRAARRRSARGNDRAGMERPPQLHNKLQARIRTRHWLSQEDDALVYAREVHMDCSRVRRDADDRVTYWDLPTGRMPASQGVGR